VAARDTSVSPAETVGRDDAGQHHGAPGGYPTLDRLSVSATLHCMTGCVIGEVTGLAIGTALGWSTWPRSR